MQETFTGAGIVSRGGQYGRVAKYHYGVWSKGGYRGRVVFAQFRILDFQRVCKVVVAGTDPVGGTDAGKGIARVGGGAVGIRDYPEWR